MEPAAALIGNELGDRVREVLTDRFLYHYLVRRHALRLLDRDEGWGGLPVLPPLFLSRLARHPTAECGRVPSGHSPIG